MPESYIIGTNGGWLDVPGSSIAELEQVQVYG